jgi:outer membrane lipoprotein LolB
MALHIDGNPVQRWHAGFSLRGNAEQGALDVLSPLGNIMAQARWNASGARVQRAKATEHYADTASMTRDITGAALPLPALFAWLEGRDPALPGWTLTRPSARLIVAQRQDPKPEVNLRIVLNTQP